MKRFVAVKLGPANLDRPSHWYEVRDMHSPNGLKAKLAEYDTHDGNPGGVFESNISNDPISRKACLAFPHDDNFRNEVEVRLAVRRAIDLERRGF